MSVQLANPHVGLREQVAQRLRQGKQDAWQRLVEADEALVQARVAVEELDQALAQGRELTSQKNKNALNRSQKRSRRKKKLPLKQTKLIDGQSPGLSTAEKSIRDLKVLACRNRLEAARTEAALEAARLKTADLVAQDDAEQISGAYQKFQKQRSRFSRERLMLWVRCVL